MPVAADASAVGLGAGGASSSTATAAISMVKAPGDWNAQAYRTVAVEMTASLDLGASAQELIAALVHVHYSAYAAAERLKRRQGRTLKLGPRSFLDFLGHYASLSTDKRQELEEEQRHLNVGLDKLRETVEAVSTLQRSLAVKRTQLEAKNAEANEKLQRMVADQKSAEEQKAASIKIQADLERQKGEISERREVVMADLADAEPAVQDAQSSVSNIKKQHLTEVRSMGNPPGPVKNAMESVCIALGHRVDSWKTVQGIIRRDDFIASIVNFDTDRQMTRAVRERMKRDYLARPEYNFETINRASKACGPLAKWVIAQVHYSEILDRVGPLREEVDSLERQALETQEQAGTVVGMISELEASIARYKDEYAALISETQSIKGEMERVQTRVDRSIQLLESLSSEKERWEASSRTFDTQISTVVGDALLSAAFLTYAGFFDQQYREALWAGWVEHLGASAIPFKPELSFADYLSTADDRLDWQAKSLPADTLCTENAIMLKRFRRYPLIIDPSGQATAFLVNEYKARKLTVTSFLDEAFLKNLESALRFGNPLLIQDVESIDPILNPVLNQELRRTGGRVLIRLGSQEIDFSPSFTMFLTTRDPSVEFSPDICSRVTFVNFTMTRSSLQSQSLDQALKSERPEVDRKRADLMRLQGEFRLRLRHLEKSLLAALNESQGNILDDDKVIDTLETLKREARDVAAKVEETDAIMREVDEVTAQYIPLAKACSSLFFVLDQLHLVNHLYQFSLAFFLDVFDFVLRRNPRLQGVTDSRERLDIITRDLFLLVYKRTSQALAHDDHVMLGALMAQIWAREGPEPDALDGDEFAFLLEGGEAAVAAAGVNDAGDDRADDVLGPELRQRAAAYRRLRFWRENFASHLEAHPDEWREFLASGSPEKCVPKFWPADEAPGPTRLRDLVRRLLAIKCLRPDRVAPAMTQLVNTVFDADVLSETAYDLRTIVQDEVGPQTPIALCSVPGFDASYRVDGLVREMGGAVRCNSVAMGANEGLTAADQAIAGAARAGHWVAIKNVHLSPSWLSHLEKKLSSLNANRNFRLFLTLEATPAIPVNFLRASRVLMNEPPPGIKASMLDSLRTISPARLQRLPAETARLFFLAAFLHGTLVERLRYTPLGWSKAFEFNDSDAEAALDTIEAWVTSIAKGRANINPASIPWEALRSLLKRSVYGGKIDNEADQRLLEAFVDALFVPDAYENAFPLVAGGPNGSVDELLTAPDGAAMDHFLAWVRSLPDQQPPQWLALPPTAERVIATAEGASLLNKLVRMRQLSDDDDDAVGPATAAGEAQGAQNGVNGAAASLATQPAWMKALHANALEWLSALPKELPKMMGTTDSIADPLFRFWAREHRTGVQLLRTVRSDLEEVAAVCAGEARQTNHNRALLNDLPKGTIPTAWSKYPVPRATSLALWVSDLARRLAQLADVARLSRFDDFAVTLGMLFSPGAYLTATRQAVAQKTRISLENLRLDLQVEAPARTESSTSSVSGFALQGLKLEGARWDAGRLNLNDGSTVALGQCTLLWKPVDGGEASGQAPNRVPLTAYLNADRSQALFHIGLAAAEGLSASTVAQRAVALRAA